MSISSSLYADRANATKDEWAEKLERARESGDWILVEAVIREIKEYHFSE